MEPTEQAEVVEEEAAAPIGIVADVVAGVVAEAVVAVAAAVVTVVAVVVAVAAVAVVDDDAWVWASEGIVERPHLSVVVRQQLVPPRMLPS